VLFVFSFSFSAFDTYVDDIYEDEQPEESCISIIQCMITLITSGVIGNSMSKWDPVKFIFDTLYFVFFGLLFTNIVSGIMIDTFAGTEWCDYYLFLQS
jgi:inositol 1,4,5-triphosphate receptor type 1/inositol 1,4,5-triphosphate receptor type 3